ncbi:MAG TPA: hypothetical protein VJ140_05895 [Actinomycetota bacterium]|nr:hypothetical protein [Actinomycetota bacterium]
MEPVHLFSHPWLARASVTSRGILAAPPPPYPHRYGSASGTHPGDPQRVVLIGCAGRGKTTLARALAVRLGARHIERDGLGDDEVPGFATQVAAAVDAAGSRWVFDGAPHNAELVVYPHADTVVVLDYPRWVVQRQVLTRSVRLWLTRRWTAVDGRDLYRHRLAADAIYRATYQRELVRTLAVEWTAADTHGNRELQGRHRRHGG